VNIEAEVTKKHDYKLGFGSAKQCSGSSGHSPALGCLGNCLAQPCSKAPEKHRKTIASESEELELELQTQTSSHHFAATKDCIKGL
jgi:hypothetical protein